jgi:hypothetical protein
VGVSTLRCGLQARFLACHAEVNIFCYSCMSLATAIHFTTWLGYCQCKGYALCKSRSSRTPLHQSRMSTEKWQLTIRYGDTYATL